MVSDNSSVYLHLMLKRLALAALLGFLTLPLTGCPLIAGGIDSVRRVGLTAGSRESLLPSVITKFNETVGWGDISTALSLVKDEYRVEVRDQLLRDKDKIKVIENAVELTEYENDSFNAVVFVATKSYKIPYYVIEIQKQKQFWEFSISGGWKLAKRENITASGS